MVPEMTEEEKDIVYKGIGYYRGWKCTEVGAGLVVVQKSGYTIKAYRGRETINWVAECWDEIKKKVAEFEKEMGY